MKYFATYDPHSVYDYASSICDTKDEALKELEEQDDQAFQGNFDSVRIYEVSKVWEVARAGYSFVKEKKL